MRQSVPLPKIIWMVGFLLWSHLLLAQGSPNVPLLVQMDQYSSAGYNDCWGYTAPDGREYALLGVATGTSIIDITDADNGVAVEVGFIPSATSLWKDIKTYQQYAYVVNESGGGLQIIDLSNLPNSVSLAATYTGFSTSHNIYIDEATGILYAEGNSSQPVRVLDLSNPLAPVQIASFGVECHDVFVRNGLAFVSEGTHGSYGIYDVTNPAAPTLIQRLFVPAAGYAHNAWSNAGNTLLMTTEETAGKTIKLWDISNLTNIVMTDEVLGPTGLAHNTHIKGHYAYVSHYVDGLRIYDIADPYNVVEVGYYDTYPFPGGGFNGAWGAFPFFVSGKVLISDMQSGLYVVYFEGAADVDPQDPNPPQNFQAYSDYHTPTSMQLTWEDPTTFFNGDPLSPSEFTIEIERDGSPIASVPGGTQQYIDTGLNDGQVYEYRIWARVIATDSTSLPKSARWIAGGSPVPATPEILSLRGDEQHITLTWRNPSVNDDGTPMDDFAGIKLYQEGSPVATFGQSSADTGQVITATFTPATPGRYHWYITALDNESPVHESSPSPEALTPFRAPFSDAFPSPGTPDPTHWINRNADVNDVAQNEPSPPYSLNLNANPDGGDQVDSWAFDLTGAEGSGIVFSYAYQPQGNGNDPETGDSLEVFFKNSLGKWVLVRAYPGTPVQPFRTEVIDIATAPNGGGTFFHSQFQVRFRSMGSASQFSVFDDWFVDDVFLGVNAPAIVVTPGSIAFDTTEVGATAQALLEVQNIGTGVLTVSDIVSTEPAFSVDTSQFSLTPGQQQEVTVTFAPTQAGSYSGLLRIASNSASGDTLDVPVSGVAQPAVGIGDDRLPLTFEVKPNYPNPFNPSTTIEFQLPEAAHVSLVIYNMLGQKVRSLVNQRMEPGYYRRVWDGRDDRGIRVSSGVYIYRFTAGTFIRVRKMVLLK